MLLEIRDVLVGLETIDSLYSNSASYDGPLSIKRCEDYIEFISGDKKFTFTLFYKKYNKGVILDYRDSHSCYTFLSNMVEIVHIYVRNCDEVKYGI